MLYTDAEGTGSLGAAAELPCGRVVYLRGRVPRKVKQMLSQRKTNIVAFELLAALVPFVAMRNTIVGHRVIHFIDNLAALACVVRGFSKKEDLAALAGRLWFDAALLMLEYRAEYVPSHMNLADGPSRDDVSLLNSMGALEMNSWQFPVFSTGLGDWMESIGEAHRAVA